MEFLHYKRIPSNQGRKKCWVTWDASQHWLCSNMHACIQQWFTLHLLMPCSHWIIIVARRKAGIDLQKRVRASVRVCMRACSYVCVAECSCVCVFVCTRACCGIGNHSKSNSAIHIYMHIKWLWRTNYSATASDSCLQSGLRLKNNTFMHTICNSSRLLVHCIIKVKCFQIGWIIFNTDSIKKGG